MTIAPARGHGMHEAMAYEAEGARWAKAGHHERAASCYGAAVDHRPDDVPLRLRLAGCLVRCNQSAAAAGEYLRVALVLATQRRDQEALALAFQVLHLDASQLVHVAVADALRTIGRSARDLCVRAAEAHLQAGRLADGLHMLQLGAEIDGKCPDVRRRLAQLYCSQHMIGQAVANLAEAGRLLLAAGNNAEYVVVAEQQLQLDPRHLETLRELPRVYLRMGEPHRAVGVLANLMRVSPDDLRGYETLAHAFAMLGRVPAARSVLERLVGELVASGRIAEADALVERARGWRLDDPGFARTIAAVREPKVAALVSVTPERTTAEGTVVLDITTLLGSGENAVATSEAVLDLSDDPALELVEADGDASDAGNTRVLRVKDLWHASRESWRPGSRRSPVHGSALGRKAARAMNVAPDDELEEVTLVRRMVTGGVATGVATRNGLPFAQRPA